MQMHMAVTGALVGLGVAVVLFVIDYVLSRAMLADSDSKFVKRSDTKANERKRMASLVRFLVLLPPVFAFAFWVIWG